jgi:hypothetical protein
MQKNSRRIELLRLPPGSAAAAQSNVQSESAEGAWLVHPVNKG